ncbi:hypothetical protein Ddc_01065 [Ditylenchus destructor]|nr:hypothetical protein Ddc_01065 [Ditylenchus destructor]
MCLLCFESVKSIALPTVLFLAMLMGKVPKYPISLCLCSRTNQMGKSTHISPLSPKPSVVSPTTTPLASTLEPSESVFLFCVHERRNFSFNLMRSFIFVLARYIANCRTGQWHLVDCAIRCAEKVDILVRKCDALSRMCCNIGTEIPKKSQSGYIFSANVVQECYSNYTDLLNFLIRKNPTQF